MTSLSNRDLLGRALRAGGAIAAIYSFLYYVLPATTGLDLVALLNVSLASASAMLMNTIGFAVSQSATLLTLRGTAVVVTNECNGLGAWLLVVGAMVALPGVSWQSRAAGAAASAVALTSINVVRVSMLCYLQASRPLWFSTFHEQVAPLVVVMAASAFVAAWFHVVTEGGDDVDAHWQVDSLGRPGGGAVLRKPRRLACARAKLRPRA